MVYLRNGGMYPLYSEEAKYYIENRGIGFGNQ